MRDPKQNPMKGDKVTIDKRIYWIINAVPGYVQYRRYKTRTVHTTTIRGWRAFAGCKMTPINPEEPAL